MADPVVGHRMIKGADVHSTNAAGGNRGVYECECGGEFYRIGMMSVFGGSTYSDSEYHDHVARNDRAAWLIDLSNERLLDHKLRTLGTWPQSKQTVTYKGKLYAVGTVDINSGGAWAYVSLYGIDNDAVVVKVDKNGTRV